jgi:hypothetical protein
VPHNVCVKLPGAVLYKVRTGIRYVPPNHTYSVINLTAGEEINKHRRFGFTAESYYGSQIKNTLEGRRAPHSCIDIGIDGQVGFVRLVRLRTHNFRLFLRQQTTNDKLPFTR